MFATVMTYPLDKLSAIKQGATITNTQNVAVDINIDLVTTVTATEVQPYYYVKCGHETLLVDEAGRAAIVFAQKSKRLVE